MMVRAMCEEGRGRKGVVAREAEEVKWRGVELYKQKKKTRAP